MNKLIYFPILFLLSCTQGNKTTQPVKTVDSTAVKNIPEKNVDSAWLTIQNTLIDSLNFNIDFSSANTTTKLSFPGFSEEENFSHTPDKKDQLLYDTAAYLINIEPTEENHETYFSLACSLWELNKTEEAKKMFLAIVASTLPCYEESYFHSSDVPADTATKIYGYGSYTSNYKNTASLYLSEIFIEQKKFDSALSCVDDAVNKYKEIYTCGTGFQWQQGRYRHLYGLCYEGLENDTALFDLLLPYCFDWQHQTIIRAIKKKYTASEIQSYLKQAVQSINCVVDKEASMTEIIENNGSSKRKSRKIYYYSGTGTVNLFGKIIDLPRPDLNDGERVTRQDYVRLFKESGFYLSLLN